MSRGTPDRKADRRLPVLVLAIMVLALLVAGCGGSSSSSSSGGSTESTEGGTGGGSTETAANGGSGGEAPDLSGQTITYLGFGGLGDETMKKAWFEPFEKETGAKVVLEAPTNYAKIQAQVQSGAVSYDLVDGDAFVIDPGCGEEWAELENVPNVSDVSSKYKPGSKCSVPDYIYSYIMAYSKKAFPNEPPESCEDFYDTSKYPGKRLIWSYYYGNAPDCAAVAAGANVHNPYPLDTEALLQKVEGIKGEITSYETGSQAAEAMANDDASMAIVTSRMYEEAEELGAEWGVSHKWSSTSAGAFGIPKGAPNQEGAEALLNYILEPQNNRRFTELLPSYGSPVGLSVPQSKKLDPYIVAGSKQVLAEGSIMDQKWWAENDPTFSEKWQSAITG